MIGRLRELVESKDGSLSLTKLAATTAHANAAWLFVYLALKYGYNEALWITYLGATIFHATYDKTSAIVKAMKEKANSAQSE